MRRFSLTSAVALILLCGGFAAAAEQGDTEIGFRLLWVTGSAESAGTLDDTGSSVTLSSGPGIEIDWILWPLDRLTVELSLGASAQPVRTSGGSLGGIDGGTLWRFPVSAVAQYRPDLFGNFDPYIGLGVVYNAVVYDDSPAYRELFSEVSFSGDFNVVAQIGVDYTLNIRWSANLDLRYIGMDTTGTFTGADGAIQELGFRFDPWVVGLGFRYRY